MLVQAEFLADLVADDVVPFLLDKLADVFTLQAQSIEAAVTDFPVRKSLVLQICDELGMAFLKDNLGGPKELFPVSHQYVNLFFRASVELVIGGNMGGNYLVQDSEPLPNNSHRLLVRAGLHLPDDIADNQHHNGQKQQREDDNLTDAVILLDERHLVHITLLDDASVLDL